jgi:hypothetical protein
MYNKILDKIHDKNTQIILNFLMKWIIERYTMKIHQKSGVKNTSDNGNVKYDNSVCIPVLFLSVIVRDKTIKNVTVAIQNTKEIKCLKLILP